MKTSGTRTIALVAHKGGVAKTTSAVQLARALVRRGLRPLVIDLDHQASATALLADPDQLQADPAPLTIREVLLGRSLHEAVISTSSGVELCPSSQALEGFDLEIVDMPGRELLLRNALGRAAGALPWDVVLLDCPPSLGLLTINALVAADAVLVPVTPAFLPLRAIAQIEETIRRVKEEHEEGEPPLNSCLRELGYLLTMVNGRECVAQEGRAALRRHAKELLWRTEIRVDASLKGASGPRRRSRGVKDYEAAAAELLRRLRKAPAPKTLSTSPLDAAPMESCS